MEEVTADAVETAGEPGSEVEPEEGTESPPSQDETWTDEEAQRKWFPEMASPPGGDAVKTGDMVTKDLEHSRSLVDEGAAGLRGQTPVLEEVLLWVKCYQTAPPATEKSFVRGRANQCGQRPRCLVLRRRTATPAFGTHHPGQSAAVTIGQGD